MLENTGMLHCIINMMATDPPYNTGSAFEHYDDNLEQESVNTFLNKLGGIAYNKSLPVIEQELKRIKNKCKSKFSYWDENRASEILSRYVKELKMQNKIKHLNYLLIPKKICQNLKN